MLDLDGFVAETNATNVFLIRGSVVQTPHTLSCLPGVTRAAVVEAARETGLLVVEKNLSLTDAYTADEMFTTGTMEGLAPVLDVDGRRIGSGSRGPLTLHLQRLHLERAYTKGTPIS